MGVRGCVNTPLYPLFLLTAEAASQRTSMSHTEERKGSVLLTECLCRCWQAAVLIESLKEITSFSHSLLCHDFPLLIKFFKLRVHRSLFFDQLLKPCCLCPDGRVGHLRFNFFQLRFQSLNFLLALPEIIFFFADPRLFLLLGDPILLVL